MRHLIYIYSLFGVCLFKNEVVLLLFILGIKSFITHHVDFQKRFHLVVKQSQVAELLELKHKQGISS